MYVKAHIWRGRGQKVHIRILGNLVRHIWDYVRIRVKSTGGPSRKRLSTRSPWKMGPTTQKLPDHVPIEVPIPTPGKGTGLGTEATSGGC